jgi:hypothetical protein
MIDKGAVVNQTDFSVIAIACSSAGTARRSFTFVATEAARQHIPVPPTPRPAEDGGSRRALPFPSREDADEQRRGMRVVVSRSGGVGLVVAAA